MSTQRLSSMFYFFRLWALEDRTTCIDSYFHKHKHTHTQMKFDVPNFYKCFIEKKKTNKKKKLDSHETFFLKSKPSSLLRDQVYLHIYIYTTSVSSKLWYMCIFVTI